MATLKDIENVIASYVDASLQAGTWDSTKGGSNLAGLLNKIAKTVQIDGLFADKLPQLDGEELPLGKTIEEYFQDLDPVIDYSDSADPMSASYPTYRPASYSYSLGRKVIKTTMKYDDYERASINSDVYQTLANTVLKRLYDSFAMFKYDAKKQILANMIAKCVASAATTGATAYTTGAALTANTRYYSGTEVGIAVKDRAATTGKTWANQIADGYIVVFDLVKEMAEPTSTETGTAFLAQVKADVEAAQFPTEGHSLNGNSVGAEQGLLLIVKKGIKPIIDVEVEAGAFHPDKLAVPAEVVVVDSFGNDTNDCFAMLVDRRAMRLHPGYMSIRENMNGAGDFINYFLHTENTAFISKNCFVKIYKNNA